MDKKIKLGNMKVSDIRNLIVADATTIKVDASIDELLAKVIDDPRTRHVYVVDEEGRLVGSVRMNMIVQYLFPLSSVIDATDDIKQKFLAFGTHNIASLMNTNPSYVVEDDTLSRMSQILIHEKINELPVVDDDKKVIGEVNVFEVIKAYLNS